MDELLHALRIKGRATPDELHTAVGEPEQEIAERLRRLADDGLVLEREGGRRPGWMLSPQGRDAHAAQARNVVSDDQRARLFEEYRTFLTVNDRTKELCASWQTTADDDQRIGVLAELHVVHDAVRPALDRSGGIVPRFGRYRERLDRALERAATDHHYVVSPLVDSYHMIWFECHEDFLVTLGRNRHEEGSW